MSDVDSDQEPIKEEPKEEPGKRFFLSHVNSYTGKALLKELRNEALVKDPMNAHTFTATFNADEEDGSGKKEVPPEGVQKIVSMERTSDFRQQILESDIIIYDLQLNKFEEVDYVIKTLKSSNLQQEKTLILISSVMTWYNTPPKYKKELEEGEEAEEEEDEPEEDEGEASEPELDTNGEPIPKKKVLPFKESDYHLRVPHETYQHFKTLETTALSSTNTQPKLKVYVLCAGILYGNGEKTFYEHFKMAWLQNPQQLPYKFDGKNLIPTIHVVDLARLVRRIVKKMPQKRYIFAIDRTVKPT